MLIQKKIKLYKLAKLDEITRNYQRNQPSK